MIMQDICKDCKRRGLDCDPDYLDTTCAVFDYLYGSGLPRAGRWIKHDDRLICSRCGYTRSIPVDYCEHCGSFNRTVLQQDTTLTKPEKM